MKNKEIQAKLLAGVLSVSMAASACPVTVMAADGAQIAADGTYTKTTRVARTEEDDADENEWDEYDVTVSVTVEEGIITDITVTPGSTYDATVNASYFNKAVTKSKGIKTKLEGQPATEETINEWDLVSGATRTSEAVKAAVLDAIKEAPVQGEDGENDNEAGSGNETGSGSETEGGNEPGNGNENGSEGEAGSDDGENAGDPVETVTYVLMNIPYAEFYAADVNNSVPVDAFSSATLNKTRTESLAGGSYHVNSDGSDITGITFPVKVGEGVDLSAYRQVTDNDSVDITVTNRGTTTTTTYTGQDALFENESYAYYVLSEAPSYYKELTVDENGNLVFGETVGEVQTITGVNAELLTETTYGDYQLDLDGLDETIVAGTDTVYGVVISTKEGSDYGLRHLENIWRVSALSWSTGFTTSVHNCPTSSAHYEAMMGQTINKVTYYTSKGIFEIPVADTYVPVKFEYSVDVEDASIHAGSTTVAVTGIPEDYAAVYSVEGLDVSVENGTMTYTGAEKGQYTLKITDANGVYADLSTTFELYTEDMPAAYDADAKVLTVAEGFSEEAFSDFIGNITSVSVNGESYSASGKRAVVIINEDGTINTEAAPFAEGESFEIVVSSTGYTDLAFTFTEAVEESQYVLMNIPYAEFYAADVNNDVPVDAFSSATLNKTRTESLAGGSYHVNSDGSDITGITFPVKVGEGVDLSAYRQVTDHDSVDITVTNRGTTTTTTYTGQDALFENESYAYYVLSEAPSYYKELTVDENGNLVFGETVGEVQTIAGVNAELLTETTYGDYQLDLDGLDETIVAGTDTVYGVVISTKEGSDYGLRHLENIWRVSALSWSTGFTTSVHNCPTSSAHYEAMMGQTINKVTYYTSKGIFEIPVADTYVPVKFEYSVDVEDASIHAGSTTVAVTGIPEDYAAVYSVEGLDVSVENGTMTYTGAEKGQYTLKITDANGVYADLSTTFELYTEDMPAAYDADAKALIGAEGFSEEAFNDFISNITSVSVNGESYAATGRNSVVIINEDGSINTDAAPLAEGESFEIVVSATGYTDLAFTYTTIETPETDEPSTDEPSTDEPSTDEPNTDEPSTDEPGTNEPGIENPGSGNSGNNNQNNTNQNNTNQNNTTTSGSTTSTTTTTTTTSTSPKTGDMANIVELLGALFTSGGVAALAKKRRKK